METKETIVENLINILETRKKYLDASRYKYFIVKSFVTDYNGFYICDRKTLEFLYNNSKTNFWTLVLDNSISYNYDFNNKIGVFIANYKNDKIPLEAKRLAKENIIAIENNKPEIFAFQGKTNFELSSQSMFRLVGAFKTYGQAVYTFQRLAYIQKKSGYKIPKSELVEQNRCITNLTERHERYRELMR